MRDRDRRIDEYLGNVVERCFDEGNHPTRYNMECSPTDRWSGETSCRACLCGRYGGHVIGCKRGMHLDDHQLQQIIRFQREKVREMLDNEEVGPYE